MWKSLSEVLCVLFDWKINILSREELNMVWILFNFPVKRCVSCSLSGIFAGKGLRFNIYVHDYKMKAESDWLCNRSACCLGKTRCSKHYQMLQYAYVSCFTSQSFSCLEGITSDFDEFSKTNITSDRTEMRHTSLALVIAVQAVNACSSVLRSALQVRIKIKP